MNVQSYSQYLNFDQQELNQNQISLTYTYQILFLLVVDHQAFYEYNPAYFNQMHDQIKQQGIQASMPQITYYDQIEAKQMQINNKKNKINNRSKNDPKMFLPKISSQQVLEDSSSANSCLQSNESFSQQLYVFPIMSQPYNYQGTAPLPKLQSDIISMCESQAKDLSSQIQKIGNKNSPPIGKKPKKENINTGHWSQNEHNIYLNFLSQYEGIMASSTMKKTSKIFKQMSELIGSRTPSQCRSHHQKFNPYAMRGENGKRLPRTERSRAGRKKKNPLEKTEVLDQEVVAMNNQDFNLFQVVCFQNEMLHPGNEQPIYMPQSQFLQDQQPQIFEQIELKQEENENSIFKQNVGSDMLDLFFKSPSLDPKQILDNNQFVLNEPHLKAYELI